MPAPAPLLALARSNPTEACGQILAALEACDGSRARAAVRLGIGETSLRRCIDLARAAPEIARRWPERARGGGVQGEEHRAKLREGMARARKARTEPLVS